jgi:hypothetical protein
MSDVHDAGRVEDQVPERDDGLSAEEQAAFDAMRSDTTVAGGTVDPEPDADAADKGAEQGADKAAPAAGDKPEQAAAEDDDEADEPAPAAGTQPQPGQAGEKPPRRVSYSKYARETGELKKALDDAQKERTTNAAAQARLDERLRILNEALLSGQAPDKPDQPQDDDPEPDADKDIFEHNKWLKRQLTKTQGQINELATGLQGERQQSQADQALQNGYLADVQQFVAKEPNFAPAYQYLMQVRTAQYAQILFDKDLGEQGVQLTPQEFSRIQSEVAREEKQLVGAALQKGKSPAEHIFKVARASGFRPQAAQQAAPQGNGAAAKPGNGAAANGNGNGAAAGGPSKAAQASEEIARIKNGQDASLSLSGGGGSPAVPLTAEKLASMSEDEFNAMIESLPESEIRRLMGQ